MFNKKRIAILIAAVAAAVGLFGAGVAFGAGSGNAEPGSQGDPIVTLSYLNSRLSELGGGAGNEYSSGTGFVSVSLSKGQSIVLSDGAELVVYSGNGTVTGLAGLMSLTGAEMFYEGTSVVLYTDYLAIGGNSGVKATGNMKLYIKGNYTITD